MKIYITAIILTLSACSLFAHEEDTQKIETLEKRIAALEALLSQASDSVELKRIQAAKNDGSLLALGAWSYEFQKGKFGPTYSITYNLKNSYKKGIKLMDASIQFSDLLGEHLYGIKVEPDLKIAPGSNVKEEGTYDVNRFMSEQMRMSKMDKKDVIAKLVVRKIVFDDNTVLEP